MLSRWAAWPTHAWDPYPRAVIYVVNCGGTERSGMKTVNGGMSSDAARRSIKRMDDDVFKFPSDGGHRIARSTMAGPLPSRRKPWSWGGCATSELTVVAEADARRWAVTHSGVLLCFSRAMQIQHTAFITVMDPSGFASHRATSSWWQLGFAGNHAWLGSRIWIREGFRF
jgi:hypothetical protein